MLSLCDKALLIKLFYKNEESASLVLHLYHTNSGCGKKEIKAPWPYLSLDSFRTLYEWVKVQENH